MKRMKIDLENLWPEYTYDGVKRNIKTWYELEKSII